MGCAGRAAGAAGAAPNDATICCACVRPCPGTTAGRPGGGTLMNRPGDNIELWVAPAGVGELHGGGDADCGTVGADPRCSTAVSLSEIPTTASMIWASEGDLAFDAGFAAGTAAQALPRHAADLARADAAGGGANAALKAPDLPDTPPMMDALGTRPRRADTAGLVSAKRGSTGSSSAVETAVT
eukprot:6462914-Amphidinium_carterae.1